MSEVLSEASLSEPGSAPPTAVRVGVITTPALASGAEERLARDLEALLSERYPDVLWELERAREGLVEPPARLTDLVDAARALLLARDWDLAVVVTEVPLRLGRRPLLSHASPTHGVALISLPALGVMQVGRRLRDAAGDAIAALIGDAPWEAGGGRRRGTRRRLVELAGDVDDPGAGGIAFLPRVLGANLRLLMGMIRANHPWRLAARLADALVGAVAAGSFALVTADVWRIAGSLGALRLAVLTASRSGHGRDHAHRHTPPLGAHERPACARTGRALQHGHAGHARDRDRHALRGVFIGRSRSPPCSCRTPSSAARSTGRSTSGTTCGSPG